MIRTHSRMTLARFLRCLIVHLCGAGLGLNAAFAWQSPQTTELGEKAPDSAELTAPAQTVQVEAPVRDARIAQRLTQILDSTDRFHEIQVEVDNGVVFLQGRARETEHRAWARDLALKTEDVVAVVNNISVDEPPLWNLEPAEREVRSLWRQIAAASPLFLIGLVLLTITVLLSRVMARLSSRILMRRSKSEILRGVIEKAILVVIIIIGLYIFLRISGLTRVAVTVLGGTGIIGLILGFAFRDIAENFLASVLISLQRPFRIGDTIELEGHLGVVQKVTTRGTVLLDYAGNFIQLTNATVYKSTIRNLTANGNTRLDFPIGIGYDSSITQAQQVALGVLEKHAVVLQDPEPLVLVEQLGAATITLRIYFWIDINKHSQFKVKSSVMRLIVRAFLGEGISLPDDAREVLFPQPVPVQMVEAGEPRLPPSPKRGAITRESEAQATEAEGDLVSESNDLDAQARRSRIPEEGADIMADGDGITTTGGRN